MVRFASRPFCFMRVAHCHAAYWLRSRGIEYSLNNNKVFFELPEEMTKYTEITENLVKEMAPFATQIKRGLHALSYTKMARFRDPLTYREAELLMSIGVALTL